MAQTFRVSMLRGFDRDYVAKCRASAKRWDRSARSAERSADERRRRGWHDNTTAALDEWAANARRFARYERDRALATIAAARDRFAQYGRV